MIVVEWNSVVEFCEKIVKLAIHQNYDVKNVVIVARFMKTNSYLQRFVENKIKELDAKLKAISRQVINHLDTQNHNLFSFQLNQPVPRIFRILYRSEEACHERRVSLPTIQLEKSPNLYHRLHVP